MKGRFVSDGDAGDETKERAGERASTRAPRPTQCRDFARRRVAEALPEIVDRFVKEAKLGSIAHAKALVGLSGLDRAEVAPKDSSGSGRRHQSLAARLLRDLKRGCEAEGTGPGEA